MVGWSYDKRTNGGTPLPLGLVKTACWWPKDAGIYFPPVSTCFLPKIFILSPIFFVVLMCWDGRIFFLPTAPVILKLYACCLHLSPNHTCWRMGIQFLVLALIWRLKAPGIQHYSATSFPVQISAWARCCFKAAARCVPLPHTAFPTAQCHSNVHICCF